MGFFRRSSDMHGSRRRSAAEGFSDEEREWREVGERLRLSIEKVVGRIPQKRDFALNFEGHEYNG